MNSDEPEIASIYSEDSFIEDVDRERSAQGVENANQPSRDYFSPSSTETPKETSIGPTTPQPEATEDRRRSSFASVESDGHPIIPATPFFSPSFYEDYDHSESSIIMFQTPTPDAKPPISRHRRNSRDRLHSFESAGSSGSLVRYANLPGEPTRAHVQHNASSSIPRIL